MNYFTAARNAIYSMAKAANTGSVDADIYFARRRQDALAYEMAQNPHSAADRMPQMIALSQEIAQLQFQRDEIIRKTFYR